MTQLTHLDFLKSRYRNQSNFLKGTINLILNLKLNFTKNQALACSNNIQLLSL